VTRNPEPTDWDRLDAALENTLYEAKRVLHPVLYRVVVWLSRRLAR
jgi:hypothetical protein